jgi:hypothetical protein
MLSPKLTFKLTAAQMHDGKIKGRSTRNFIMTILFNQFKDIQKKNKLRTPSKNTFAKISITKISQKGPKKSDFLPSGGNWH